jgi:hypothetical protein
LERKKRHRIFAPQGWVVTAKLVEEGELVGAGAPVGRVADFRRLVVPLSVSDAELDALRRRSSPFTVGLGSRQVAASIHWINPEFDPRTRKLDVELRIEDDIPEKRGGLVCSLPLRIRAQGLRAPKAAVINRYDNPRVILAETGEAVPVLIVGQSDGYFFLSETAPLKPGTKLARPSEGKMP